MARVIHLGGLYGAVGSWMARAAAEAVLGTGNTPAYAVLRDPGLCGSTKLVQKGREAGAVLTGLGIEGRAGAEAPTAKTGDGDGAAFAEGSATGLLRNLEWHG